MMVRKCDICGSVIHKTTPKYRVIFDGWLYTERKDICVSCFERIREEIKQADTPQTECRTCKWAEVSWTSHYCDDCKAHNKYEPNDTPQTDCQW